MFAWLQAARACRITVQCIDGQQRIPFSCELPSFIVSIGGG